ncbi:MAG: 50S ribosomal protein L6 [Nitrospiria bacterium]
MSRIGHKKIQIPNGVEVRVEKGFVYIKGPKGEGSQAIGSMLDVAVEGGAVLVKRASDMSSVRSLHGLLRSEIANVIQGVTQGFEKVLELHGVGYRATLEGKVLVLNLGYSHPIRFDLPAGIDAVVEKQTLVAIKGINKYLVGETAAKIRDFRPPEPYKGKGVKYRDERIVRKEGKKGK